jgi:hypothetical protein
VPPPKRCGMDFPKPRALQGPCIAAIAADVCCCNTKVSFGAPIKQKRLLVPHTCQWHTSCPGGHAAGSVLCSATSAPYPQPKGLGAALLEAQLSLLGTLLGAVSAPNQAAVIEALLSIAEGGPQVRRCFVRCCAGQGQGSQVCLRAMAGWGPEGLFLMSCGVQGHESISTTREGCCRGFTGLA